MNNKIIELMPDKSTNFGNKNYYYDFIIKNGKFKGEKIKFPFIFLGFEEGNTIPNFKKKSNHINIEIQSGGYSCNHHRYTGWVLEPLNIDVMTFMINLNDKYLESCIVEKCNLKIINEYNQYLKEKFSIGCNNSYYLLEESIYPIDNEYINKLSLIDNIESFLKENINYKTSNKKSKIFETMAPIWDLNNVQLYIFGENSD